jgi:hypothetical protein
MPQALLFETLLFRIVALEPETEIPPPLSLTSTFFKVPTTDAAALSP